MKKLFILFCLCISTFAIWAQERNIITSDSVKLYVNVKGQGPACLYLHGGPGSGSYWLEKFFGSFLEQHFQMIYLDQRGVGRSSSPKDNNYSMDRMVRDFEEVRESLGIKHWLTLGHSFGGLLQMGYVNSKPNSINGLIFINCTLSMENSFGTSWLPKAIELTGNNVPEVCLDTTVSLYQRMLAIFPVLQEKGTMWKIFYAEEANEQKMNETYGNFKNWNHDFSNKAMEVADYWTDFTSLCPKINKPVLFFYGKTDWAIGPNHYKKVAFPNMMLWGSNVGHMPFMENKEDLEKAIVVFIGKYKF
jgi:proline iminopeptidase